MTGLRNASRSLAVALAAALAAAPAGSSAPVRVGPVPEALRLDPFYAKHVDARGIAIVGSRKVPDEALLIARDIVLAQLARRGDIGRELVARGTRIGIIAPDEGMTDLPEHRHWKKPARDDPRLTACERDRYARIEALSDSDYWNRRSRGSGGYFTTVGAENLLAIPGSRYFGQNILVHEFAHAIFYALQRVDPALHARIRRAYDRARRERLWEGEYLAVTIDEYWAGGTQIWFETAMIARPRGAEILSARDLERHDPALYSALAAVYGSSHRIAADRFHRHPVRSAVPAGWKSADCDTVLGPAAG